MYHRSAKSLQTDIIITIKLYLPKPVNMSHPLGAFIQRISLYQHVTYYTLQNISVFTVEEK
jgi:hypothetical protein